jgi:hypothetical protein
MPITFGQTQPVGQYLSQFESGELGNIGGHWCFTTRMLEYLVYCQINFPVPMPATTFDQPDVFFADIADLEAQIATLKESCQQVQADGLAWTELQARQQVVQSRGQSLTKQQELQEIAALAQVLEERLLTTLEQVLENHQTLPGWQHLFQDLFWNAVRFGGVGLLLGWGLRTWLG